MSRDNISDENSDSALDDIVHGGYSGGDNTCGDLTIASRDRYGIYGQSSFRQDGETDQEANGSVGNTGVPGAVVVRPESKNCALAALANSYPSGQPNQPSDYTHPSNLSERRGATESGSNAISRAAQPLQSNNAKIPKRRQKGALTASSIYGCRKRHPTSTS